MNFTKFSRHLFLHKTSGRRQKWPLRFQRIFIFHLISISLHFFKYTWKFLQDIFLTKRFYHSEQKRIWWIWCRIQISRWLRQNQKQKDLLIHKAYYKLGYNHRQNIWNKVKKSSKIEKNKKTFDICFWVIFARYHQCFISQRETPGRHLPAQS